MCFLIRSGLFSTLCIVPSGKDSSTSPASGFRKPTRRFSIVVFPAPLVPISPKISPVFTSRSMFWRTVFSAKLFVSPLILIITSCSSCLYDFSIYSFTCDAGHPALRSLSLISSFDSPFSALRRICSAITSSICLFSRCVFKKERYYSRVVSKLEKVYILLFL